MEKNNQQKYISMDLAEIFYTLRSRANGLSSKEAKQKLDQYGLNEITAQKKRTTFNIFISQFANPLVLILLVATLISGLLGEWTSAVIITLMILLSAILSFIQEYHSEKTMAALKNKVAVKALVLRDKKVQQVNTAELVIGDIAILEVGKIVPADLRLIETNDLSINQAVLSGESFPVEKETVSENNVKESLQARNLAFSGSHVVQGYGKGIVIATGQDTFLGQTAKLIEAKEPVSQFQKGINDFGYFLFRIIIAFSLAVFIFLALFRGSWLESLLFALAIAVGISPELLPLIITINLSRGARIMAKKKVVVKRLMSIENLGNADVLCTDKTGTLTEGKIELKDFLDFAGNKDKNILFLANLCNTYAINPSNAINPLDLAIVNYAKQHQLKKNGYKIIENIAFDFYRRRMSVIVQKNSEITLLCKGASDEMLKICSKVKLGDKDEDIKIHINAIKNRIKRLEENGYRLLLIAQKPIAKKEKYLVKDEVGLILLGALAFFDPPKVSAAQTIKAFIDLGIQVKILTGDNEIATERLCQEIDYRYKKIVLGEDLENISDEKLKKLVNQADIFAKVTPEHKLKIVKALSESGHSVAFLGDGVNDAPALKAADVGISVDKAVDVAREAADVILLKKSLAVLIDGIKEGRKTFGNTLKYILCTISSNYGNMLSVTGAALILPFIPMLPVQVILLNFFSDAPMLAISTDNVDDDYIKKPKHWDIKKIRKSMNYFGLISSLFDFITFGFLLIITKATMPVFQSGWFFQSFLTEVLFIFVIRTKKWFWQSNPSKTLIFSAIITTATILILLYTNLRNYFGFGFLKINVALTIVGIALIYYLLTEFFKKIIYKKFEI
ncbi:MAG: magnesium-translocating P-type ATPase [Candidatus Buchananbacteria bacterium RBG_13_39_9]|uniref:Magnesium-transporting ATPase, P-type 1 n=1 Tax=Candidatus Buchananbacteria bacterium RBG_13_39_9 TaxID=1797531 RepID=A0A1G1XLZ4_9BACT|nr:MAG: magnesium-translocating P-type ATPase [Candidatus Buchananbacteria bacterium RBG_13_39_9]